MEALKTVKRYHLSKDRSGWNFTVKEDGMVWGSIHYRGVVHGFEMQEPPELFFELKSLLHAIPCSTDSEPERILVVWLENEDNFCVSLDDCENYDHDSSEASLWRCLESLAKRIIKKVVLKNLRHKKSMTNGPSINSGRAGSRHRIKGILAFFIERLGL